MVYIWCLNIDFQVLVDIVYTHIHRLMPEVYKTHSHLVTQVYTCAYMCCKHGYTWLMHTITKQCMTHLNRCRQHLATRLPTVTSCKEIYDWNPNSPSGYYWRDSSPPELMYCAMNLTRCGNTTGGWTGVAHIDMTRPEGTCPSPLVTIADPH